MYKIQILLLSIIGFLACSNPMESYEDEIKSGFQFINNVSDTTYIIYNDGDIIIVSSHFRENNDSTVFMNTSILAKQKTADKADFYYYLNGCKIIYSFSKDTVYIFNQYNYNPDGGHPSYSSTIEIDPPESQHILVERRQ